MKKNTAMLVLKPKTFFLLLSAILVINSCSEKLSKEELMAGEGGDDMNKKQLVEQMYKYWHDVLRNPETNTIPWEQLPVALAETKRLEQIKLTSKTESGIPGIQWVSRGPANVGGRSRTFLVSPLDPSGNTGFAGSVGGGIWKCTNLKSAIPTWQPVNDFMQNIAISSMAYNPANPSIMYAGTGEGFGNVDAARGLGIAKSTDGGNTWTFLATTQTFEFYYVNKVIVNSQGHLYAATSQGLFRSKDGGINFEKVQSGNFGDIEINSAGVLYASGASSATGMYKSTTGDSGTWTNLCTASTGLPTSGFVRVESAIAPNNPSVVYSLFYIFNITSYSPRIYKSTDGGATFTKMSIPVDNETGFPAGDFTRSQGWYDLILKVDPNNSDIVYTGGIDLFKSKDGGTSWTQISHWYGGTFGSVTYQYVHADQHYIEFEGNNSDIIYFTNDGGLWQTTNGTADVPTINKINTNYTVTQFYSNAVHPGAGVNFFLAGAQDNGTQRFTNAGFGETSQASGGDGAFCNIDEVDPSNMFTQYVNNNYYRSINGGETFTSVTNSFSGTGRFINPSTYDGNTKTLYAATSSGQILRWKNAPTTSSFAKVTVNGMSSTVSSLTVSKITADKIYVGDDGGQITEISNASTASSPVTGRSLGKPRPSGYLNNIWEDPTNGKHIVVVYSGYITNSIFETYNADATTPTWTVKDGNLPSMPAYWIVADPGKPTTDMLVATELGVFSCTDFNSTNPTWFPASDGMANVRVTQLHMRTSDKLIVASTHGRGLFTCDVFMSPTADFLLASKVFYTGGTVAITDNSVKATQWQWDFNGDGTWDSNVENPSTSYNTPGTYNIKLRINNNPSLEKTITITVLPNRGTPYLEADGGNFETTGDFAVDNKGSDKFSLGNSTQAGKDGTHSGSKAWVIDIDSPQYVGNSTAYLYTPNYNCTAAGDYTISFYAKYAVENTWDGFRVEYSIDKGNTWQILGNVVQANWYDYNNPSADRPFPKGEAYFSKNNFTSYTLCTYKTNVFAGKPNVAFRIAFKSDPFVVDAGLAVDDWSLNGPNNTALPVVLSSFTGKNNGNNNVLQWTTSSEINSSYYDIERSFDSRSFEKIASVKSKNNINGSSYNVNDNISALSVKNYYYRLKMVDVDGKFTYSPVVNIKLSSVKELISVLGNITSGPVKIIIPQSLLATDINAELVNSDGRVVKQYNFKESLNTIDLSNMARGMYYLRFVQSGAVIQTNKIVKE